MTVLLDVNVLIAPFDPAHIHHEAAHAWFGVNRKYRWATCALTENAFVRVLYNPSYPGRGTTIEDARGITPLARYSATDFFGGIIRS